MRHPLTHDGYRSGPGCFYGSLNTARQRNVRRKSNPRRAFGTALKYRLGKCEKPGVFVESTVWQRDKTRACVGFRKNICDLCVNEKTAEMSTAENVEVYARSADFRLARQSANSNAVCVFNETSERDRCLLGPSLVSYDFNF